MRILILLAVFSIALPTLAAQKPRIPSPAFNGHRLGDTVNDIREKKREGRCEGKGKTLTECTIFDNSGVAYYFYDGHIVHIEVNNRVSANAVLPFGIRIGNKMENAVKLSFPKDGEKALITHDKEGVTLTRMIRESGTEYEFELQLHFNNEGALDKVIYKDIL